MTERRCPSWSSSGRGCMTGWPRRGFPARQRQRELPPVRQAELRVRAAGSSRARAAVAVDPDGTGPDRHPAAVGGRAGQGPRRAGELSGLRRGIRADRGGERGDLRGPARPAPRQPRRRGDERGLCEELAAGLGGGSRRGRAAGRRRGRVGHLGEGLDAVELAIRTAMIKLGGSLLEACSCREAGHIGPRMDCGNGHHAEFVGYRDKTSTPWSGRRGCAAPGTTALPASVASCPGTRPRRHARVAVAGAGQMIARAAAADPFAPVRRLLAELAGIELTVKRMDAVGRSRPVPPSRAQSAPARTRPRSQSSLPAPAYPLTGQAVPRHGRHRCAGRARETKGRDGKAPTGRPTPAKSSSPACSPRPASMTTASRCATRTPPATCPARARRAVRHPGGRRSPPPRHRPTSASSSSSATAPPGSGTSPRVVPGRDPDRGHLSRPRTPARACHARRRCSATRATTGSPPGSNNSTPATSTPSWPLGEA